MSVPSAAFGPGILILTRTDVTPSTPINVGFVQEFSLDFTGNTKQLYGQNQFPLVAARATIKATGKMKNATLSGTAMNNAFYGNSFSTATYAAGVGVFSWTIGSTFTASSGSTSVSITGTFDADLGVTYAAPPSSLSAFPIAGLPLQRLATTATLNAGQYSVTSTGGYNFSTADAYSTTTGGQGPINVKITYTQTGSTAGSTLAQNSLTVVNQLIGFTPTFQLDYYTNLNQPGLTPFAVRIFQCVAAKHVMAFKLEDFMMPEFDFDIFANNSGQVYDLVVPLLA